MGFKTGPKRMETLAIVLPLACITHARLALGRIYTKVRRRIYLLTCTP